MMYRSRERTIYIRAYIAYIYIYVYLYRQIHAYIHTHRRTFIDARCVVCISLSARSAPLGHKELLAPILFWSYQRHLSVHRAPSTYACILLHPTISYINSAQFETYRRNIPSSSPLCLCRFFSRKTRFYRYPCASFTLICYGDAVEGKRKRGRHDGDVRRKITWVQLSESQESREIRLCHAFTAIRYIYWLPRCATWLISHTVHIVVGTNLLSEDILVSTSTVSI